MALVGSVLISAQHRAAILPWNPDVAAAMPHAKRIDWQGTPRLVVPHDVQHARVLRNVGIHIPSPILSFYDWCGQTPWQVQRDTAAMLTVSPRAYVLNEMRTGKTKACLWAFDYLRKQGEAHTMLVVAPLSTLNIVWGREIMLGFPHLRVTVVHGDKAKRTKLLAKPSDIYVINPDGLAVMRDELLARRDIDVVVFDEATLFKSVSTNRWKLAAQLVKGRKYTWAMTGRPTPNGPLDAYGLGRLITPERAPRYFTSFRDQTMIRISQFRFVPKREANDIVDVMLKPSVRFTRADIADSPPTMHLDRECALSSRAVALMKAMVARLRVMEAEGNITAANAGVLLGKLLQMATGWVYCDDGTVLDVSSPTRLQAVLEIVEQTDKKALVFVPYVNAVRGVCDYLCKNGIKAAQVYGETPPRERDRIFGAFQQTDSPEVLVMHPGCAAHGLRLDAADTSIWYGPPPSNEMYWQANARAIIPGLTYSTAVFHIIGHRIEQQRYASLRRQNTMQEALLDILHGVNEE